jgi:hypothetical protein
LTAQTPFDLGHKVCGETPSAQGLLQDLGHVLRLATIMGKALLRWQAASLSSLRVC